MTFCNEDIIGVFPYFKLSGQVSLYNRCNIKCCS